jgi:hypothetical protein
VILSVSNPHANLASEHENQPNNPQLTYSTSPPHVGALFQRTCQDRGTLQLHMRGRHRQSRSCRDFLVLILLGKKW